MLTALHSLHQTDGKRHGDGSSAGEAPAGDSTVEATNAQLEVVRQRTQGSPLRLLRQPGQRPCSTGSAAAAAGPRIERPASEYACSNDSSREAGLPGSVGDSIWSWDAVRQIAPAAGRSAAADPTLQVALSSGWAPGGAACGGETPRRFHLDSLLASVEGGEYPEDASASIGEPKRTWLLHAICAASRHA